jgi:hypothetical protein
MIKNPFARDFADLFFGFRGFHVHHESSGSCPPAVGRLEKASKDCWKEVGSWRTFNIVWNIRRYRVSIECWYLYIYIYLTHTYIYIYIYLYITYILILWLGCKQLSSDQPVAFERGLEILVDEATEKRSARMRVRRCVKAPEASEVLFWLGKIGKPIGMTSNQINKMNEINEINGIQWDSMSNRNEWV